MAPKKATRTKTKARKAKPPKVPPARELGLPTLTKVGEGGNCHKLTIGDLEVWFSYEEPIAFRFERQYVSIRKNEWGVATGRHRVSVAAEIYGKLRSDKDIPSHPTEAFVHAWQFTLGESFLGTKDDEPDF